MKFDSNKANYSITEAHEKSRETADGREYVTFKYWLANSKKEHTGILLNHKISDPVWEMESSTHDYRLKDAHTLEFHVQLKAEKTTEVEFTYIVGKSAH